MSSDGFRIRTCAFVALLKVVPETLKSSDRTKAASAPPCSTMRANPSRRDTSWPLDFFALIDQRTFRFTHTRGNHG